MVQQDKEQCLSENVVVGRPSHPLSSSLSLLSNLYTSVIETIELNLKKRKNIYAFWNSSRLAKQTKSILSVEIDSKHFSRKQLYPPVKDIIFNLTPWNFYLKLISWKLISFFRVSLSTRFE